MTAVELLMAFEYPSATFGVGVAVAIAILLVVALLVPYVMNEIRRGKVDLGPRFPDGTGDTHPGRRGDPAPGQPDGQIDPYDPRYQK
ncbi:MAG TPA: hypothetical protein VGG73_21000 [Vicinamibacterales bacterium]|jgi:hypothetical protein